MLLYRPHAELRMRLLSAYMYIHTAILFYTVSVCVFVCLRARVCFSAVKSSHSIFLSLSRYLSFCFLFLFFFRPFVFVPSMPLLFFIHSNPNFYKGALSDNIEIGCEHFTEKFKWLYPHVALTRSRKSFVKLFFFEQRNHNCFLFVSC